MLYVTIIFSFEKYEKKEYVEKHIERGGGVTG
jgi:hypothetical protein